VEKKLARLFKGKVVMVTGGTGSIGSQIVSKLLTYPVRQVRVFSRDEHKQFMLQQQYRHLPAGKVSFLIGDIRDRDRVFLAMEGVDIVFNAAAMKHVPMCEYNPFEAIKTNVLGSENLVDAARRENVDIYVHVSTDKAAMPINVMGATKLLAEKIALSANHYRGNRVTRYCAVRFGNVIGSRGSVVPLFLEQIKRGGPVTLTDPAMTRFMLSIPQAVDLVLKSALLTKGEELFILKMPVVKIGDLTRAMIEVLAPRFGHDPKNIEIKISGRREGEKVYETLLNEEEAEKVFENAEMFCIAKKSLSGFSSSKLKQYRSDKVACLKYPAVVDLMREICEADLKEVWK